MIIFLCFSYLSKHLAPFPYTPDYVNSPYHPLVRPTTFSNCHHIIKLLLNATTYDIIEGGEGKEKNMDIRLINSNGDIMNISRLHISVRGNYLIGLTEDMNKEVLLERCQTEKEALAYLDGIKEAIKTGLEEETSDVIIDLEGKADGK